MKNLSCCFTGHRDIPLYLVPEISEKIRTEAERLIASGVTHFYTGGAVGFDMLALKVLTQLKKSVPSMVLHVIAPCEGHMKNWNEESKVEFCRLIEDADELKYLSPFYFSGCMQVRNRYLVDHSSYCIAFLERNTGGSAYTVKYAEEKGLSVINIAGKIK